MLFSFSFFTDRQHVQFLSVALKRRIVQFYQNEKLAPFITGDPNEDKDTIDPILSERDSDKDLHILWVYSDEDTGKGENHIVPLLPKGMHNKFSIIFFIQNLT